MTCPHYNLIVVAWPVHCCPTCLLLFLPHHYCVTFILQIGVFPDLEEIIKRHAYDSECGKYVANSISDIVKRSSLSQSLKGILTAGLTKSLRYSFNKIIKKIKSRWSVMCRLWQWKHHCSCNCEVCLAHFKPMIVRWTTLSFESLHGWVQSILISSWLCDGQLWFLISS